MWYYVEDEGTSEGALCYGQDTVFMGSFSAYAVYALNATTGHKIWETQRQDPAGYAGAYGDGKLFVGCQSMHETCYNAATGAVIWNNDDGVANRAFNVWNVCYAYGRVYYHDLGSGTSGATKCYDANTGALLWKVPTYEYIGYYQTVIADGKIYGQESDGSTTTNRESQTVTYDCWDAFTGQLVFSIPNMNIAWQVIAYGCLYISTATLFAGGTTYCLSTALPPADWAMWRGNTENPGISLSYGPRNITAGPSWETKLGGGIISSPVVSNGKLYIGCNDQNVYCLNAYTGAILWKFPTQA